MWLVGILLLRTCVQVFVWTCVFISREGHVKEHVLELVLSQSRPPSSVRHGVNAPLKLRNRV